VTGAGAARSYDFRMIPIGLIDEPEVAMRRSMDDGKLAELAVDIRANGLRQPIGVRPTGDRFRVSYGHRRRLACVIAGESEIPCFVLDDDSDEEERAKIAENWLREETNPAEEARYFDYQLNHRYGGDIEKMCAALHVTEGRVNRRLDLLRGYEDVFEAIQAKQISLAVARELNKVTNDAYRKLFLRDAIGEGMTAGAVEARRVNVERMALATAQTLAAGGDAPAASSEVPIASVDRCVLCDSTKDVHEMSYVRVHRSCLQVAERAKGE
jgi:ParB/RepB/Spo0J family partition protein